MRTSWCGLVAGLVALLCGASAQVVEGGAGTPEPRVVDQEQIAQLLAAQGRTVRPKSPEEVARRTRLTALLRVMADSIDLGERSTIDLGDSSWYGLSGGDAQLAWRTYWTVRYSRPEVLARLRALGLPGDDRALMQTWFDDVAARLVEGTRKVHGVEGLLDEWSEDYDVHLTFEESLAPQWIEADCNGKKVTYQGPDSVTMATYEGRRLTYAMAPVQGREPSDAAPPAAPTRQVRVEIIPNRLRWEEAESIEGKIRVTNLSDRATQMSRRGASNVRPLALDGTVPETIKSTMYLCGNAFMGDAKVLEPGETVEWSFSVRTDPSPRLGGTRLPPGRWLLAPPALGGESRIELVGEMVEIEITAIDEEIGARIVDWEVGGESVALQREDGTVERVNLVDGRVTWSDESGRGLGDEALRMTRLARRSNGVSTVVLSGSSPGDARGPAITAAPIGGGPAVGRVELPFMPDSGTSRVRHDGEGTLWYLQSRYIENDGHEVQLVWVNIETGATDAVGIDTRDFGAISPRGDFAVRDLRPTAPLRGARLLPLQVWALTPGAAPGWRTVMEEERIADGYTLHRARLGYQSWMAGRDGLYRARASENGVRFVSYDGERAWELESALVFPIAESADGRYVALSNTGDEHRMSDSDPRQIEVWDTQSRRCVLRIDDGLPRSIRFAANPARLIAMEMRGTYPIWYGEQIEVYDLGSGRLERVMRVMDGR